MIEDTDPLRESRRRAMFAALVAFQDQGLSVSVSRAFVSSRFDVSAADVVRAERDGLTEQWPPLAPPRRQKASGAARRDEEADGTSFAQ